MNVLLTCAGRRNYMVDFFRSAVRPQGKVFAANSIAHASAMAVADEAFVVPGVYHPDYVDCILSICRDRNVRLVLSLFDLDIPVLAAQARLFSDAGICLAVSSLRVADLCNDKYRTLEFVRDSTDLLVPESVFSVAEARSRIESSHWTLPVFVKPRFGYGSIAIQRVDDLGELGFAWEKVQRIQNASPMNTLSETDPGRSILIQESCPGSEFGLDVVNDLEENYQATFVKRKLGMRSGETDGAVTVDNPRLRQAGEQLSRALRHVGNLDVDVFVDGESIRVLELNARFGGGYPFSHLAGADLPRAYVAWTQDQPVDPQWLRIEYGVTGLKGILPLRLNSSLIANRT